MSISFNPSFMENPVKTVVAAEKAEATETKPANFAPKADEVVLSKKAETPKKSILDKTKGVITSIKKGFITAGAFATGLAKGVVYGAATGATILVGSVGYRALKHGIKNVGTKPTAMAKAVSATAAAAVLFGNMVSAKLNANGKTAEVDHRWRVGHRDA